MIELDINVNWKMFLLFLTFLIANIVAFILWLIGIENRNAIFIVSCMVGIAVSFILSSKIETEPYDEDLNDNKKFYILFLFLLILLILQTLFLPSRF